MICLPTFSLGMLFAALALAQLINRDTRRLPLTFLFGLITLGITYAACMVGGEAIGWVAFAGIIALIVLVMLATAGVFDSRPSVLPNKCIPSCGSQAPKCEQRPLCPGDEPCPIPDYLPE